MSHTNIMSQAEAASFLGVTERTVRNYIKKGLLSKHKISGKTGIPSEEVVSLSEDMNSSMPVVSRSEIVRLRAKVRRLESHMEAVLSILDAKDSPLALSQAYAKDLYEFCQGHLKRGSWDPAEIGPWVEIFDRISEDDLLTLQKASSDPHPWRPFLKLCVAMMSFVVGLPEYSTSLEMQTLHRKLASSRRRLRVSSFIYGEIHGDLTKELLNEFPVSSTNDVLFRKILKNG